MFYLSGEGYAGYSVEPSGEPNNAVKDKQPIEYGVYDIVRGDGNKWTGWPRQKSDSESKFLGYDRAVGIHYAGKHELHDGKYELMDVSVNAVSWTTKCMVVSNDYSLDNSGYVKYNSRKSFETAYRVAQYCGATGYTVRIVNKENRKYYICNGVRNNGIKRIIK